MIQKPIRIEQIYTVEHDALNYQNLNAENCITLKLCKCHTVLRLVVYPVRPIELYGASLVNFRAL